MKFSLALICSALVGLAAAHNFSPEHIAKRQLECDGTICDNGNGTAECVAQGGPGCECGYKFAGHCAYNPNSEFAV